MGPRWKDKHKTKAGQIRKESASHMEPYLGELAKLRLKLKRINNDKPVTVRTEIF